MREHEESVVEEERREKRDTEESGDAERECQTDHLLVV